MTPARGILIFLAALDLALGLGSILVPQVAAALLWPAAGPGGLVLLRRTGAIWLFFAAAEVAALQKPTADRLRLVALLRWMDVLADVLWLAFGGGFTAFGWLAIGSAPPLNVLFGILLWRAAAAAPRHD